MCLKFNISGGNCGGETLVSDGQGSPSALRGTGCAGSEGPISNTKVKSSSAYGTALVTVWESRSLPDPFFVPR